MDRAAYDRYLISLGTVLRREREARGLSLRQLGLMVGVDHKLLCRIEHGEDNVTFKTLYRIAEGLDVAPGVLFAQADELHIDKSKVSVVTYTTYRPRGTK